jgi:hypothetical protein
MEAGPRVARVGSAVALRHPRLSVHTRRREGRGRSRHKEEHHSSFPHPSHPSHHRMSLPPLTLESPCHTH